MAELDLGGVGEPSPGRDFPQPLLAVRRSMGRVPDAAGAGCARSWSFVERRSSGSWQGWRPEDGVVGCLRNCLKMKNPAGLRASRVNTDAVVSGVGLGGPSALGGSRRIAQSKVLNAIHFRAQALARLPQKCGDALGTEMGENGHGLRAEVKHRWKGCVKSQMMLFRKFVFLDVTCA